MSQSQPAKSLVLQEIEVLENFLRETPEHGIREAAQYIFERVILNAEKLKQTKEPHLEQRLAVILDRVKKYLQNQPQNAAQDRKLELWMTNHSYELKIKNLQKQEKINVAFLVSENSKWNGASLYKKFENDQRFSPMVLVVIPINAAPETNVDFIWFKERIDRVFAVKTLLDLCAAEPDIVFYQQPWIAPQLENGFSPFNVSRYALCLYFSYCIDPGINFEYVWKELGFFFRSVYKHFVFDADTVRQFESYGVYNTIATGQPKLDVYAEPVKSNIWRDLTKIKIIYAPHHSFEENRSMYATFPWNGKQILQLAKNNPHTEWVFKPHPSFISKAIKNKILTPKEIDEYFNEWSKIGQIYDKGDYFDIFRTSDLMITDCDSFLAEYLPTGKPVMHLLSERTVVFSSVTTKCARHYYKIHNLEELNSVFDILVNKREDPLKAERQKDAEEITFNSADNIYNELLKILENKQ